MKKDSRTKRFGRSLYNSTVAFPTAIAAGAAAGATGAIAGAVCVGTASAVVGYTTTYRSLKMHAPEETAAQANARACASKCAA
jgi:hypothetical protein